MRCRFLSILPIALSALAAPACAAVDPVAAKTKVDAILDTSYPHLERLYKDIHSHPELGFQEVRTAALLASEMRALGFEVTEKVGGTGIVALYRNGPGPVVLVRTELDALPMEEKTGLPYASRVEGYWSDRPQIAIVPQQDGSRAAHAIFPGQKTFIDHSCGHDSHMAWWVGTAQALVRMKDEWHGTLMFIGQPSEETVRGAKAMLADGLFTRFPKPDFGFAAHVGPDPAGTIAIKDGIVTSASDNIEIVFKGRGGHGATPSATIDPIVMGAHFVSDVQTIISREKDSTLPGVITIGSFQAGTVGNIIPDDATLKLTLRSFVPEVRAALLAGVKRTANAVAEMANAPMPQITALAGTASVVNDSTLAAQSRRALTAAFGDRLSFVPAGVVGSTVSEDFSEYSRAGVPSIFFSIGGTDPKTIAEYKAKGKPVPVNHSPYFAPMPEPTIKTGVEVLTLAVLMVIST